jgi:hypothetical protein
LENKLLSKLRSVEFLYDDCRSTREVAPACCKADCKICCVGCCLEDADFGASRDGLVVGDVHVGQAVALDRADERVFMREKVRKGPS